MQQWLEANSWLTGWLASRLQLGMKNLSPERLALEAGLPFQLLAAALRRAAQTERRQTRARDEKMKVA